MAELTELEIPEEILALRNALYPAQQRFADLILFENKSVTQAYRETHPKALPATCWAEGSTTQRLPKVAAYLAATRRWLFSRNVVSVEEMRDFCARTLRTKLSDLYDEDGCLIDEASDLIQEFNVEETILPDGSRLRRTKVKLMSKKDAMAVLATLGNGAGDDEEAQALARKIRPSLELPAALDNPHS